MFNAANAVLLPALRARRIPVATHVDGLEWKRAKWTGFGQTYYRRAEELAVRWSAALIADAVGIADYYRSEFDAPTELLSYGAPILRDVGSARLPALNLRPAGYHLVVARFEPENHVDVIVEGFRRSRARLPLVVVGSAPYSTDYIARVEALASGTIDPADRLCVGSGPSERALRQRRNILARSLCRGHQPVASACHGSRRPSGRLRRRLQPGGGRQRSASVRFFGIGRTASRVGRGQRRLDALSWTKRPGTSRRSLPVGRRCSGIRATRGTAGCRILNPRATSPTSNNLTRAAIRYEDFELDSAQIPTCRDPRLRPPFRASDSPHLRDKRPVHQVITRPSSSLHLSTAGTAQFARRRHGPTRLGRPVP